MRFDLSNRYLAAGRHLTPAEVDCMPEAWFGDANAWHTAGMAAEMTPLALTHTGWWSA